MAYQVGRGDNFWCCSEPGMVGRVELKMKNIEKLKN